MIDPNQFIEALKNLDIRFVTGVPDSLLKEVCACITDQFSEKEHIIATNEGSAVGLGMGHYLSTGRPPLVYMQNSGLGNAVNPIMSLAAKEVYAIPMILMIGWRGEMLENGNQLKDEPQHIKQGQTTTQLLDVMGIPYRIVDSDTDIMDALTVAINSAMKEKKPAALVVRKNAFSPYKREAEKANEKLLSREQVIEILINHIPDRSPVVSTTGKASRELYELRKKKSTGHERDLLTVGGMGHASQIACGIALAKPDRKVYCFDGDGALLMHMGGLTISADLENFIHIVLNNGSHDSVGGQPTKAAKMDLTPFAEASGYGLVESAKTEVEIIQALNRINSAECSSFLEIKCVKGARGDLGRPDKPPHENKRSFMKFLES